MESISPNYIRRYPTLNIISHISYPRYAGYYNILWIHGPANARVARVYYVRIICAIGAHRPNISIGLIAHEMGQLLLGLCAGSTRGSGP